MPSEISLATNGSPSLTTWIGDATSQYYISHRKDGETPSGVTIVGSGTWNSVNALVELCANPSASPQKWGTYSTKTANFAESLTVPEGCAVRVTVNSSGSPLPSLTFTMVGDFDGQTGTPAV